MSTIETVPVASTVIERCGRCECILTDADLELPQVYANRGELRCLSCNSMNLDFGFKAIHAPTYEQAKREWVRSVQLTAYDHYLLSPSR